MLEMPFVESIVGASRLVMTTLSYDGDIYFVFRKEEFGDEYWVFASNGDFFLNGAGDEECVYSEIASSFE